MILTCDIAYALRSNNKKWLGCQGMEFISNPDTIFLKTFDKSLEEF